MHLRRAAQGRPRVDQAGLTGAPDMSRCASRRRRGAAGGGGPRGPPRTTAAAPTNAGGRAGRAVAPTRKVDDDRADSRAGLPVRHLSYVALSVPEFPPVGPFLLAWRGQIVTDTDR